MPQHLLWQPSIVQRRRRPEATPSRKASTDLVVRSDTGNPSSLVVVYAAIAQLMPAAFILPCLGLGSSRQRWRCGLLRTDGDGDGVVH